MGTFATKKILPGNPSLIPAIAEQIRTEFMAEQFEVIFLYPKVICLKPYLV